MSVILDARLTAAAKYVRKDSVTADIGCDHGKLSIYLAQNKICSKIIACDLRPMPLDVARKNAKLAGVDSDIEFRLGDGFKALKQGEASDFVVAGMSGVTIAQLLADAPWVCDEKHRFIFVPATRQQELREYLWDNGFELQEEVLASAAGRYYAVMCVRYTGEKTQYTPLQTITGLLPKDENAKPYFQSVANHIKRMQQGATGKQKQELEQLYIELCEEINL